MRSRLGFFLILLGACTKGPVSVALPAASVTSAQPIPPHPPEPAPPDPVVDLLHTVDCTVAVSSKVDNPHDFPEHLVDGKPETAWNGKTGELDGYIAFRVPRSARVTRVELTSGYDKVNPKGDLFTMNHRITKVRLSREGVVVKEVDLDPSMRVLQAIDIDEPGGDFKLDVLETKAGTEKRWKELTVSEFRVWGRAGGAPENPAHIPKMAIGSLDGTRPQPKPTSTQPTVGPFATTSEMCKAYDRALTPVIDAAFPGDRYPGKIEGPHCRQRTHTEAAEVRDGKRISKEIAQGPFKSGAFFIFDDQDEERMRLVLETSAGFARTNVELWSRYHNDPGCLHGSNHEFEDAKLVQTATGQDVLVIRILHLDVRWMQMDPNISGYTWVEKAYACRVDDKGAASCDGPLETARAHDGFPDKWDPSDAKMYAIDVAKTPWTFRKDPTLGPAGDLRLSP